MIIKRLSHERGSADHGWLKTHHTFSFADYYDPEQMGFSDLRVINEDWVEGGKGFATHPHRNMEIFTYILEGALAHRDSMGYSETINPDDVQMMSAGTGIRHSEYNPLPNTTTHLLQIWIEPDRLEVAPRYAQIHVPRAEKIGNLRLIIAPEGGTQGSEHIAPIYQSAKVFATIFAPGGAKEVVWTNTNACWGFVHIARGEVMVRDAAGHSHHCREGDSARLIDESMLTFSAITDQGQMIESEFLLFELRPLPPQPS